MFYIVVTTISIILSSNKIQNGHVLYPLTQVCDRKRLLNECCYCCCTVKKFIDFAVAQ